MDHVPTIQRHTPRDPTGNTLVMGLAEGRRVWSPVFVNDTVLATVEQGAVT